MKIINFSKKKVSVKQSVRKGKLVKGYSRLITKDKDGKNKLTPLSKGLIGGTIGLGLLAGYKNRRQLGNLINKSNNKIDDLVETGVKKAAKPVSNVTAAILMKPYRNQPDLSPEDLKVLRDNIQSGLKKESDYLKSKIYKNKELVKSRRKAFDTFEPEQLEPRNMNTINTQKALLRDLNYYKKTNNNGQYDDVIKEIRGRVNKIGKLTKTRAKTYRKRNPNTNLSAYLILSKF